jgi:hypothetical protein
MRRHYPSDVTDGQWQIVRGILPKAAPGATAGLPSRAFGGAREHGRTSGQRHPPALGGSRFAGARDPAGRRRGSPSRTGAHAGDSRWASRGPCASPTPAAPVVRSARWPACCSPPQRYRSKHGMGKPMNLEVMLCDDVLPIDAGLPTVGQIEWLVRGRPGAMQVLTTIEVEVPLKGLSWERFPDSGSEPF